MPTEPLRLCVSASLWPPLSGLAQPLQSPPCALPFVIASITRCELSVTIRVFWFCAATAHRVPDYPAFIRPWVRAFGPNPSAVPVHVCLIGKPFQCVVVFRAGQVYQGAMVATQSAFYNAICGMYFLLLWSATSPCRYCVRTALPPAQSRPAHFRPSRRLPKVSHSFSPPWRHISFHPGLYHEGVLTPDRASLLPVPQLRLRAQDGIRRRVHPLSYVLRRRVLR